MQKSSAISIKDGFNNINYIKYLFIQREFKALKARRMIEANSYSISKSFNTASRALKPALREALKHSTSALH
ncbi:hypothetical protein GCM10007978_35360 [Shewanella hanedai]|nr:hypothetical protein GCM10007978_35360 [Shewanella hanedai]